MKISTILSTLAISSIFLAGTLHAGGTRTLTTGIGSSSVPTGLPSVGTYSSRRNLHAGASIDNFRAGGFSNHPTSTFSTGSAPTSFPGQGASYMNPTAATNAGSNLPTFSTFPPNGSSNPGTGASGLSVALGTVAPPSAIPGNIPVGGHAASVISSGIGSSSVGFGTPTTTISGMSNISNSTALNAIPQVIGGGIPSTVTAPPAVIPPPIPTLPAAARASTGMSAAQAGLDRRGGGRP